MKKHTLLALMVALVAAVAVPATAAADDQAVWHAYAHSQSTDRLVKAADKFSDAFDAVDEKATRRRLARALKASRRLAKAAAANRKAMKAEDASSDDGARGKKLLVKAVSEVRAGALLAARGVRAAQHGHTKRANRLFKRASRALKRAARDQKRGEKAMVDAGIDPDKKVSLR
jgi:hypothetical protein